MALTGKNQQKRFGNKKKVVEKKRLRTLDVRAQKQGGGTPQQKRSPSTPIWVVSVEGGIKQIPRHFSSHSHLTKRLNLLRGGDRHLPRAGWECGAVTGKTKREGGGFARKVH